MIQAMFRQWFAVPQRPPGQTASGSADFAALFGDATKTAKAASPAAPAPPPAVPGDPDVQGWLNSFYAEQKANNPLTGSTGMSADTSYEAAPGAGSNFTADSVFGPDAIYTQALANQIGNSFAAMTGDNPKDLTSQLPGIPTTQAQQEFDRRLSLENLDRLQSGQPIDTTAYWSDPGSITSGSHTYTSKDLGYAGACQSSGPQPIYISQAFNLQGTNKFIVPGYSGTVEGVQPGRYYTLQQLEQAGLKTGQPDAQSHPGSWTTTQSV